MVMIPIEYRFEEIFYDRQHHGPFNHHNLVLQNREVLP
jgi:hypothetical protein